MSRRLLSMNGGWFGKRLIAFVQVRLDVAAMAGRLNRSVRLGSGNGGSRAGGPAFGCVPGKEYGVQAANGAFQARLAPPSRR